MRNFNINNFVGDSSTQKMKFLAYKTCLYKEIKSFIQSRRSLFFIVCGFFFPYMAILPTYDRFLEKELIPVMFFFLGGLVVSIQFMWESTTADRIKRTQLYFINLNISLNTLSAAKITLSLMLLLVYVAFSIPITYSWISFRSIGLCIIMAVLSGIIVHCIVLLVFNADSMLTTVYVPIVVSFLLYLIFFNINQAMQVIFLAVYSLGSFVILLFTNRSKRVWTSLC